MFDYERLDIYQHLRETTNKVLKFLIGNTSVDDNLSEQLRDASLKAILHLAEGTGRMIPEEKKKYYETARSSVFKCVSLLQIIRDLRQIEDLFYSELYDDYTRASKMLLAMYRSFDRKRQRDDRDRGAPRYRNSPKHTDDFNDLDKVIDEEESGL